MYVCLTGGAGFIGRALAEQLRETGYSVIALDILNRQVHLDIDAAVGAFPGEVLVGDVRDEPTVRSALARASAVVHLAAETGVGDSMVNSDRYRSVNVDGTAVVARVAAALDIPMLFLSSRAVYGEGMYECVRHGRVDICCCPTALPSPSRETDPLQPTSVYGRTKVAGEQIVRSAYGETRSSRYLAVRPQNVIGPGQAPHNPYTGVLAAFAARLRAGLPPIVYGDGSQSRDFVDVRDAARVLSSLTSRLLSGEDLRHSIVNLGSGNRTTLGELAEVALSLSGVGAEGPEYLNVSRLGDIAHACADTSLLRTIGAPIPTTPLSTSVREFMAFAERLPAADPGLWAQALSRTQVDRV